MASALTVNSKISIGLVVLLLSGFAAIGAMVYDVKAEVQQAVKKEELAASQEKEADKLFKKCDEKKADKTDVIELKGKLDLVLYQLERINYKLEGKK